eukprot:553040-Rhodomonas_salina.1
MAVPGCGIRWRDSRRGSCRSYAIRLRACYAIYTAYGAMDLRACYAMSGTDIAFGCLVRA